MVFESVVADVLNRFLGDYVENLDRSQLKIGIWGGDVVLENLVLKQNALDELDLPVQTIFGHLGKLVLKIPWKNLYGASVEASIERLFLLVAPNRDVKYDATKEERIAFQNKQNELLRVEEAKKREAEKDKQKVDDSFVEKLVTQIIKNVQLNIKDIHIRYEDKITNPRFPFSCGITLHNLSVNTTDDRWKRTVVSEAVTKIYKILDLEGLALYWNSDSFLYSTLPYNEMLKKFQDEIATKTSQPTTFRYILGPISASAKLKLNPKPEQDVPKFVIPKCVLNLDMDQLAIGITKDQYQDIMKLADSVDRMVKGNPYRKYRPLLNDYKGHYKEWWKFAFTCILEDEVKRKRRNWDWNHIYSHRSTCKQYAIAYQNKLEAPKNKISKDLQCTLDDCEKRLDLFNLVVIRQRIEMEVTRLGKAKEEANKSKGWFGSWWGGRSAKDDELTETTDIMRQFEKAMTPDEKAKLFQAIDYQENSSPTHLPVEFIANECHFILGCLLLSVSDGHSNVLTSKLNHVQASLEQRPSANGLKVIMRMQEFSVSGFEQNSKIPSLVTSKQITPGISLLDVMFETNPLDESCGQRIKVSARPLEVVYDAQTIIKVVEIFKPPSESSALAQLQAAAESRLTNLKEKSALGLQYAVSQHTIVDIDIDFCSSYIILPHGGFYTGNESCVVVNLGAVSVKSAPRSAKAFDVHKLFKQGANDEEILKQAILHSYDKFILKLTDMQIVIANKHEDWKAPILQGSGTSLHLLQPTSLKIEIDKCLIINDPRLPKIKAFGHLSQIGVNASEDRLITLLEILVSVPFPKDEEKPLALKTAESRSSSLSLLKYFDPSENKKRQTEKRAQQWEDENFFQLTEVEANFVMDELIFIISRKSTDVEVEPEKLASFAVHGLKLQAVQKTLMLDASITLVGVEILLFRHSYAEPLKLVYTPLCDDTEQYLLSIKYTNVDKKCPDFHSKHGSVEQYIELDFRILKLLLHQDGLQELLNLANQYSSRLNAIQGEKDRIASAGTPLSTIMEDEEMPALKLKTATTGRRKKRSQFETIGLKVDVFIEKVAVEFATEERSLAKVDVSGFKSNMAMRESYMQISATLQDIKVIDQNPESIHKEILSILDGDAINVELVIYNTDEFPNDEDMSVNVRISCVQIIFLNWFVSSMLSFLDNFQAAQQAIKDASALAAESAKANVQNAYEKATKIAMLINLKAPIVIAPENSKSVYAVMIDFGHITMQNKFLNLMDNNQHEVVVDELTMKLENLKLSRVKLTLSAEKINNEKMLLQPTSFALIVKRNLSSWYRELPDIEMSGRLKAIVVTLSSDDFKMVMKILSENLTEGSKPSVQSSPAIQKPQLKTSMSMESKTSALKKSETAMHAAKLKDVPENISTPKTTIKFTFNMDSLTIEMMNKTSSDNNQILSPVGSGEEVGLARFSLLLLSMKGKMLSDNSLQTSILLVDCLLDDTRPNRKSKLTRFMHRKSDNDISNMSKLSLESPEKLRSMIDITFTKKDNDTFLDVRVFSFNLILCMDFMMRISDFVTSGLAVTNPEPAPNANKDFEKSVTLSKSLDSKNTSRKVSRVERPKSTVSKPPPKPEETGMITVNLKVEKPDIILVESMDDKDCNALVLNNEVVFKMRMNSEQMTMTGSIKQLQLFTCKYSNLGKSNAGRHSVLVPLEVSLQASNPNNAGWHVDIILTDIRINVSPATIDLLNRVLVTMTRSEDETGEKVEPFDIYKDLWEIKPFLPNTHWFLRTEMGEDALNAITDVPENLNNPPVKSSEICKVSAPVIVLCIEAGLGNDTIPMLNMQASLEALIKDWSSQLNVESSWAMQVSYYNNILALWEPLIEPVEVLKNNNHVHVPWELRMQVQMDKKSNNPDEFVSVASLSPNTEVSPAIEDTVDGEALMQPSLSVQITSTETLELTITNTALQVLTQLGKSFSSAVQGDLQSKISDGTSPYLVQNDTGFTVILQLDKDPFIVYEGFENQSLTDISSSSEYRDVVLEHGASVPLQLKSGLTSVTGLNEALPDWKLHIKIANLDCELCLPVVRADKRYFPLKHTPPSGRGEAWGIISEVVMVDGTIHINIRSIIQVVNCLSVPVEVYFMTESGSDVELLGHVKPKGTMNLPLRAVYTNTCEIFFTVEGYKVSKTAFVWKDLQKDLKLTQLLQCGSRNRNLKDQFIMKAVGVMEQVFYADTSRHTMSSSCFSIYLRPAVVVQNTLPVDLLVSPQGIQKPIEHLVKPGESLHLPQVQPGDTIVVLMLPDYLEKCWVYSGEIPENAPEFAVWSFDSHDSTMKMTMDLGMHCSEKNGSQHFSLYCPFWMLNKTGLPLAYRSSEDISNVLYHPADYKEPILFSFRAKNFFGKKKAAIKLGNGEWSDKFSLDIPGSSGVIQCIMDDTKYQIGVANTLTYNGLTKQVTFTPYYLLINNSSFAIECQEVDRPGDPYIKVEANSSRAFWPKSEKADKLLRVKAVNEAAVSAPFIYTDQHTSLLKLNNKYGGINVETLITEGGIYVTFGQYRPGLAPALIINHTPNTITLWEKESVNIRKILGMHSMMYSWENPAGPRKIVFEAYKKKEIENDLRKDGLGEFTVNNETRIYWVSFLDGMQRILLFTTEVLLAHGAHTAGESGVIDTEVTISMHGVGLSLVNNLSRQEILYISMASSGVIWEQSKPGSKRFKALGDRETGMIEEAYQRFLAECEAAKKVVPGRTLIDTKTEVDFETMELLRPHKRTLKRISQPGLWAQWGGGTHRSQLHARLHRLQIDQQLSTPTFPVILAPVPPPKSVALSHGIKPFIELCIVERIMEHTKVKQFKYYKLLVQEFHVKIDMGLINALMGMFPEEELSESVAAERFALDMEASKRPLESIVEAGTALDMKHFYDELHLSPLKVHVSFSLGGATQLPTFLGTILQGLGVTLTDMNDVVFKLAYYERKYEFLSQKELVSTATSHYTGQALKQLYVLVLGLDVIGNPYGLVVGITKGVEDLFYEPFQGAIQGPGEFAEGLILGVRSLVGHTVGGAAGAVSRITGAMGHGLAALSLDEEYQRKRRDNINKPPANIQEGIARSGKGLFMGVVDGVSGVFTKPISGAREEGVGGFFKGLGKGAVGLIARPTAGVVDFASGSLDAVKRAADVSSEVTRYRAPRWLEADGLVRPYSRKSAEGFKILRDLEKGKYVTTDTYETHIWVVTGRELVLCTDKQLAYLQKNTMFGGWQIVWSYTWQEIPTPAVLEARGVWIPVANKKSASSPSGKLILIAEEQHRRHLIAACERLMKSVC